MDHIKSGEISLVINTPLGRVSRFDEQAIRRAALQYNVPCVTTMTGAQALVEAIAAADVGSTPNVHSLQELHAMRDAVDAVRRQWEITNKVETQFRSFEKQFVAYSTNAARSPSLDCPRIPGGRRTAFRLTCAAAVTG